jgi:predicted outer membrane repeat protein
MPARLSRRRRFASCNRRLALQPLEPRQLLATFTVSTLVDESDGNFAAGDFSLREAIEQANLTTDADTINFSSAVRGAITLSGSALSISNPLAINGPGANLLAVSTNGESRIFVIASGSASISGLELVSGHAKSGDIIDQLGGAIAIFTEGPTDLDRLYVHGNSAGISGGAIYSEGSLRITNSTISNNEAGNYGGAIYSVGNLVVINSTISGNHAVANGGIDVEASTALLRNCSIVENVSGSSAIFESAGSSVTLYNSIVAGNTRTDGAPNDLNHVQSVSANNLIGSADAAGGLGNGGNGNVVGDGGAGTRPLNSILEVDLADNGGPTPTHKLVPNSPAIDKGKNSLALDVSDAALTTDQRGFARIADRDNNGTATVDMGAVELRPFALSLSGTITYTENGAPLILAAAGTFTALDSKTFNGGKLTVTNAASPDAGDRLTVQNQGSGAGQVGASGNEIRYGGVLIGTKTGGSGATPLVVTFNGSATAAAVQAVVRRVAFNSVSDNPPTAARSIRFAVSDGHGSFSKAVTKTVNVISINDKPVIGSFGSALTYTEDTAAIGVADSATVSDADSPDFDTGKLWVKISANAESSDRLSLRSLGGVTTSSNEVFLGGDLIGTFTGGSGSTALVVTFNNLAHAADVQAVLRAVAYQNVSQNPSSKTRTLSVILTDGDGGTSATSTKSINVKPVNDKPVLGGISGSVGYVHNAAAIVVAGSATVTDVDSANFGGGRLRVRIDAADASNRLAIAGGFTVDASNNVKLNGVTIGTRTSNGFGSKDLIVVFNTNATKAIVQQLVRAINFKTVNGIAGSRNVIFSVSDGDGGLSAEVSKTVNVT